MNPRPILRREAHRSGRAGWLRAAVLGADDGIVSTASLVIGVAAAAHLEQVELAEIYVRRGLDRPLAATVAERLMEADPLGSHVRDELGLQPGRLAAAAGGGGVGGELAVGAALPLVLIVLAPVGVRILVTALGALGLLAVLGGVGARLGGARAGRVAG